MTQSDWQWVVVDNHHGNNDQPTGPIVYKDSVVEIDYESGKSIRISDCQGGGYVVHHHYKIINHLKVKLTEVSFSNVLNTLGSNKFQARKLNSANPNDYDNDGRPKQLPDIGPLGTIEFDTWYTLQNQDPNAGSNNFAVTELIHPRFTVDYRDLTEGEKIRDVFYV